MDKLIKAEMIFDKIIDKIGKLCAYLMILMMLNVFYDVIMRYIFREGSIAMQELEWHIFSVIILLGVSYTLKEDGHVRVDVLYDRWSPKTQAIINIVGVILFLWPLSLLIAYGSIDFVVESYQMHEISGDPGGLTHRWILKAFIPFSFLLLIFASIGFIIKNINIYRGYGRAKTREDEVKEAIKEGGIE